MVIKKVVLKKVNNLQVNSLSIKKGFCYTLSLAFLLLFSCSLAVNNNSCNICYDDIFDAAKVGDLSVLEKLINDNNIDINLANKDGKNLLYVASGENNFSLVKYLIEKGADKSINKAFAGWTSLYNACYNDNLEMVIYLLAHGAVLSVNKYNNIWKRTPLYWACRNNNIEMVKRLLASGAAKTIDIETAFFGGTNLYWACYNGSLSMVKCLVAAGADINKVTSYNESILYWACKFNNMEIFNYLFECWTNGLFNWPALVKISNKYSNESPLYWASNNNNFDMVKKLVENGGQAIINLACKDNNKTALYCACYNNNPKMVKFLIDNGAIIDQESLNISVNNSKIYRYFQEVLRNK